MLAAFVGMVMQVVAAAGWLLLREKLLHPAVMHPTVLSSLPCAAEYGWLLERMHLAWKVAIHTARSAMW